MRHSNQPKLDNVIVFCHGHEHRKTQEVNYDDSTLMDANPDSSPDIIFDLESSDNLYNKVEHQFNYIISANCAVMLELSNIVVSPYDYPMPIDGDINIKYIRQVRAVANVNGNSYFLTKSPFAKGKQLYIDKLYVLGFNYVGQQILTFDKTKINFMKFQIINIPTKIMKFTYLKDRLSSKPQVKRIICKYFSKSFSTVFTLRVNVTKDFKIDDLFITEEDSEEDTEITYWVQDITFLSYYTANGSQVILWKK